MDVDVLLWGGTHKFEAYELEGKFFVNPGSATGAFSSGWLPDGEEPTPSFCLMDVSRSRRARVPFRLSFVIGTGRCPGVVRVSAEDGHEWRGKCRRRESVLPEKQQSDKFMNIPFTAHQHSFPPECAYNFRVLYVSIPQASSQYPLVTRYRILYAANSSGHRFPRTLNIIVFLWPVRSGHCLQRSFYFQPPLYIMM